MVAPTDKSLLNVGSSQTAADVTPPQDWVASPGHGMVAQTESGTAFFVVFGRAPGPDVVLPLTGGAGFGKIVAQ